ncbi:MAG: hypothetical protein IPJ88_03400 [Myxococcales bacterium]|nr:MAG: hypothetical protein IPJ88_03400 [Myxococcales bacterium]
MRYFAFFLCLHLLGSCSASDPTSELVIDLKTDLVPGTEFVTVRTELSTTDGSLLVTEQAVSSEDNLLNGKRIAEFRDLASGEIKLVTLLIDKKGNSVIERPSTLSFVRTLGLTVVISRDCLGVSCPDDGTNSALTACLGGICVDPKCNSNAVGYCPVAECHSNDECPADSSCSSAVCIENTCLVYSDDSLCNQNQWCHPDNACIDFCSDGLFDYDETDTDCGGSCSPCTDGAGCASNDDCISKTCKENKCFEARCDDNMLNGDELDVDCGGSICDPCLNYSWSKSFPLQSGLANSYDVSIDAKQNTYVSGSYEGKVNFGGLDLDAQGTSNKDLFIASFEGQDGSHRWSRGYFTDSFSLGIVSVSIGSQNNLIVMGYILGGSLDFGGGALIPDQGYGLFVASLKATDGGHLWSRTIDNGDFVSGVALAHGQNGRFFIAGAFTTSVDFGNGHILTADSDKDAFLAGFNDADGSCFFAKKFQDFGNPLTPKHLAADNSGNVYLSGTYYTKTNLGGSDLITSDDDPDLFFASFLQSNGTHNWSFSRGSNGVDEAVGLAVDDDGHLVASGNYRGTINFGGGPLSSAGTTDSNIYLASFYTNNGSLYWAKSFGSQLSDDSLSSLALDANGRIFVAGNFSYIINFGLGDMFTAGIQGTTDIFLASFQFNGTPRFATRYGGTNNENGPRMAVGQDGLFFLWGVTASTFAIEGDFVGRESGNDIYISGFVP